MNSIFEYLSADYDCRTLFKVGPFNRFGNTIRVETPELCGSSVDAALRILIPKIKDFPLSEVGYIVLIFEKEENVFPKEEITPALDIGINENETVGEFDYYDPDEEMYFFLRAFKITPHVATEIIRLGLGCHLDSEHYLIPEYFLISEDLGKALNVYDDRGFDIVNLAERKNTPNQGMDLTR